VWIERREGGGALKKTVQLVRPAWVVDSVKAKRLLAVAEYSLIRTSSNVPMTRFFLGGTSSKGHTTLPTKDSAPQPEMLQAPTAAAGPVSFRTIADLPKPNRHSIDMRSSSTYMPFHAIPNYFCY
jgi:hypothetical protein